MVGINNLKSLWSEYKSLLISATGSVTKRRSGNRCMRMNLYFLSLLQ